MPGDPNLITTTIMSSATQTTIPKPEEYQRLQLDPFKPILTLSRSITRPYQPSDADALAEKANSPLIARNMRNAFPSPYTCDDAKSWIQLATTTTSDNAVKHAFLPDPSVYLNYAIVSPKDGSFLGGIGLRPLTDIEHRTFELGYWLAEDAWGQGIMSELVQKFVGWAFHTFPDLLRLEANVYDYNIKSSRVLASAGFRQDGIRRSAGAKDGKIFDMLVFGMIGSDVQAENYDYQ
ncbi:acyl-CoA N-acyltransferase [Podospora australis]|uniref:Acyl-CoA N-acyltransferase n=1 Tax=Podospora australis TaxID=1536484 RepID=A0AAN7APY9_9PEZI|nr:acyl-CoA N-acyltransferase [Podospora australis]